MKWKQQRWYKKLRNQELWEEEKQQLFGLYGGCSLLGGLLASRSKRCLAEWQCQSSIQLYCWSVLLTCFLYFLHLSTEKVELLSTSPPPSTQILLLSAAGNQVFLGGAVPFLCFCSSLFWVFWEFFLTYSGLQVLGDILRPVRQRMLNSLLKINEPCAIGVFFSCYCLWTLKLVLPPSFGVQHCCKFNSASQEYGTWFYSVNECACCKSPFSDHISLRYSIKTHVTSSYVMLLNIYASYVAQCCDLFINFLPFLLHVPSCCVLCIDATDCGPVNNLYLME